MGKTINKTKDGITSQNTDKDNRDTVSIFFVSIYIQINAKTEIMGIDANIPPARVLFFDTSVITTIKTALIKTFMM